MPSPLRQLPCGDLLFWCPACGEPHRASFDGWNGDEERPTFMHPVIVKGTRRFTPEDWELFKQNHGRRRVGRLCRSFVSDGRILYLSDCTHALRGQMVPLPPFKKGFDL